MSDNRVCGQPDCGHVFEPGELRYRADDGKDYCTPNGHGQQMWLDDKSIDEIVDDGPDDLGYSNRNRLICTDPSCTGEGCGADNH